MNGTDLNDPQPVARTLNDDETNAMCLMIQQCLIAARISINDGLEIHARMMMSVLLTLHSMDREKAAVDAERILGSMVANLRDTSLDAQTKAQGGVLLQ